VKGRPLYVRRSRGSAVEYFESQDFDLTTYKAHPWLPVSPDDTIFECVFLPTKPDDIPGSKKNKTYDYPRGRLARVPVEWLYDSDTRPQDDAAASMVAAMVATATDADYRQAVIDVAVDTFGPAITDDGIERAGFDPSKYGADADERGAINQVAKHEGSDARTDTPDDGLGDFGDYDGEE